MKGIQSYHSPSQRLPAAPMLSMCCSLRLAPKRFSPCDANATPRPKVQGGKRGVASEGPPAFFLNIYIYIFGSSVPTDQWIKDGGRHQKDGGKWRK